jgi:hypothetical protein
VFGEVADERLLVPVHVVQEDLVEPSAMSAWIASTCSERSAETMTDSLKSSGSTNSAAAAKSAGMRRSESKELSKMFVRHCSVGRVQRLVFARPVRELGLEQHRLPTAAAFTPSAHDGLQLLDGSGDGDERIGPAGEPTLPWPA